MRRISVKRGRVWPSWSHSLAGEFEPTEQIWTCPNRAPCSPAFPAIDLADKNLMPVKSRDRLLPAKVTKLNLLLSQYVLQQESELSPAAGLGYPKQTWGRRTVSERSPTAGFHSSWTCRNRDAEG